MSCEDIPSLLDLQNTKKHVDDFGRLMGTGTGTSTNEVTGQVRPTINKVINDANAEFDATILNMGFSRIGTFSTGATLTNPRQTLLWDIADGGDGQEYGWSGSFPKVVPAASNPNNTGGIGVGSWVSRFDPVTRIQLREAIRRSYADAGFSLVGGSFQSGFTLVNANDVALDESSGRAFSGAPGIYAPDTPTSGFNDVSNIIGHYTVVGLRSIEPSFPNQRIKVSGYDATDSDQAAAGEFYYHQADTTSPDNGGTVIVTSGGKRWKRLYVNNLNVHYFGPRGFAITDHAPAFNRAINYANGLATESRGFTIYHPDGVYDYRAGLSSVAAPSIAIVGESDEGTVVVGSAQELFRWGSDGIPSLYVGAGIKNMCIDWRIKAPETVSSGKVIMLQGMSRISIDALKLRDVPNFITAGKTEQNFASNILVSNIRGFENNCGLPFIDLRYGAGMELINVTAFVGGVLAPAFGDTMTTVPGTIAIRGWLGFWDTFQATNCIFERFAVGLSLAPSSGKVYQNFFFTNCIFDYIKGSCFDLDGAGAVTGVKVIGGWGVGWEGYGISISQTVYANHIEFVSTKLLLSGLGAIFYAAQNARNVVFSEIDTVGCNHKNQSGSCATFVARSTGFNIRGGSYNRNYTGEGMQPQASVGISIGANCDFYDIDCQDITGSVSSFAIVTNASPSKNRNVANNRGQLDNIVVGLGSPGPNKVNTYPFDLLVSVSGSTTGISLGGNALSGLTNGTFTLKPGYAISVDTTTPNFYAFVK